MLSFFCEPILQGKGTVWNGLRQQLSCCSHWRQSKPDMLICQVLHTYSILRYSNCNFVEGYLLYEMKKGCSPKLTMCILPLRVLNLQIESDYTPKQQNHHTLLQLYMYLQQPACCNSLECLQSPFHCRHKPNKHPGTPWINMQEQTVVVSKYKGNILHHITIVRQPNMLQFLLNSCVFPFHFSELSKYAMYSKIL